MKKHFLFLLAMLLLLSIAKAQQPYKDALKLKKVIPGDTVAGTAALKLGESDSVYNILVHYVPASATDSSIKAEFATNPFMRFDGGSSESPEAIAAGAATALSAVGGLDVTTIVEGLSSFMIDRAKQELTISFFNRFKKFVDDNAEVQVMFPKTSDALEHLLSYQYPEMLPALRTAFNEDLGKLTYHLDDVIELPRYKALLKEFPEVRVAIHSIRIIHNLENGVSHPADILNEFAQLPDWKDLNSNTSVSNDFKNMGNCLKLSNLFSQSLRTDSGWVTPDTMLLLVKDEITLKLYLGLIYQQVKAKDIRFINESGTVLFTDLMAENADNLILFRSLISEFIGLANKVQLTQREIVYKKKNRIAVTNDDAYNYINQGIDVIEYAFEIVRLFDESFVADDYVKLAKSGNDLYRHIYKKEYTSAIINSVDIINQVINLVNSSKILFYDSLSLTRLSGLATTNTALKTNITNINKVVDEYPLAGFCENKLQKIQADIDAVKTSLLNSAGIGVSDTDREKIEKLLAFLETKGDLDKLKKIVPVITKYGIFIANVANAKTPDEVKAAIEAAVLPVGSSGIKKNSCFNVAIQSYLGAYYRDHVYDRTTAWKNQFGVIAPVGISASWGFGRGGSVSAFASLIDIGAMVDYQLTQSAPDSASKDFKIRLGQIFSPGGYLVYGFPFNIPLSLGAGGQYGPGLGSIDKSGTTVVNNPSWRWNIFLAVDIPLFNFYNKEKRRKYKFN